MRCKCLSNKLDVGVTIVLSDSLVATIAAAPPFERSTGGKR
jgi:hypothetical protein